MFLMLGSIVLALYTLGTLTDLASGVSCWTNRHIYLVAIFSDAVYLQRLPQPSGTGVVYSPTVLSTLESWRPGAGRTWSARIAPSRPVSEAADLFGQPFSIPDTIGIRFDPLSGLLNWYHIAGTPFLGARIDLRCVAACFLIPPALVVGRNVIRRARRRIANKCVRCSYSLLGNVSGVCPECGTEINYAETARRRLSNPSKPLTSGVKSVSTNPSNDRSANGTPA